MKETIMEKEDKGPGCLMYIFFMFFLVCLAIWFLFSNVLNFKTLLVYSPSQYAANIWHFHDDYYCRANDSLRIYRDIIPADSVAKTGGAQPVTVLKPGKRFKLKGYRNKEYVQWVAAKIADGSDIVYGYFMIPEKVSIPTFLGSVNRIQRLLGDSSSKPFKNRYFTEISVDATEKYRGRILLELKNKLASAVHLEKETNPARMQQIKESKNFKIIDEISSDSAIYYCPKDEYEEAVKLYEAYLGDGFDNFYLQTRENYDPLKDSFKQESFFLRVVGKWYSKLFAVLLLLLLFRRIFRGRKTVKE
jgi:hypothetical protein